MSEQAAESTAAVATAPQPEPSTESVTPVETGQGAQTTEKSPEGPKDRRSARKAARDIGRRVAEQFSRASEPEPSEAEPDTQDTEGPAAAKNAAGRTYDKKTGKFLPENQDDTETPPETVAASDEGSGSEPSEPEADTTADGFVKVPLPEGHPLRDQGVEYIRAHPEEERHVRASLNGAVRRSELDEAIQRAEQLERKLIEERTARQFYAEGGAQLTAADMQWIEDNRQAYGDEYAERAKKALLQEKQSEVQGRQQEVARKYETQRWERKARAFKGDLEHELRQRIPNISQETLNDAFTAYGTYVSTMAQTGRNPVLDRNEFFKIARPYLGNDPAVRRQFDQMAKQQQDKIAKEAEERAKREAAKREEQRLKEVASRHATNPKLGAPPTGARTGEGRPEQPDRKGMTPTQIRNQARERAREAARAIGSRG